MAARTISELSVDTQTLERLLWDVAIGDVVTYADMSQAIGRDVQNKARHLLTSAVRRVLRDKQMVFEPVTNVGIKRLCDEAIVGTGETVRKRIYGLARRGILKMAAVADFDALSNEAKVKHNAYMGTYGAMVHITRATTVKKIEAKADAKPMPVAKYLEAVRETL